MTSTEGNGGGSSAAPAESNVPDSQNTSDSATTGNDQSNGYENPSNTRRPANVALKQQRMKSWQPLLDPKWVIATYLLIGIIFIPTGIALHKKSKDLIELKTIYESYTKAGPPADVIGCEIGNSPNQMYLNNEQTCQIQMQVPFDKGDMQPPVMVHYELANFHQNYLSYFNSFDQYQLFGSMKQDAVSAGDCNPLNIIDGTTINPCGLIANTLFNDVITLVSIVGPDGELIQNAPMVETGIAWSSDLEWKYRQPDGFRSEQCASCDQCDCTELNGEGEKAWSCKEPYTNEDGVCFRYYYPKDDTTQYLYETYPMVVSPLDGVTNEHFVVWMRTAALPLFRKLYGYIEQPIPAGSVLTFNVQANFIVERLEGHKALVVSNTYIFGGKNHWLGTLFIIVGSVAAIFGVLFLAKDVLAPRKLGDRMYLKFKDD
eukprot:CAMPEP_0172310440 /NCGR_PEP_ID=MMETSP1058-20130122/11483_1 /TAXON_ID=83371 /ORGANISM="Detonula confervacea, Strain CCMP 353" /LENGTH=429 /DNA_ID=CAMNT_0013023247 /DNA_START=54 /DNA_END=1343 /DNA_ORIENTATION=+